MGFFTRETARQAARRKGLPLAAIEELGAQAVVDMNPKAVTPNMTPAVDEGSDILVLGAWPTIEDDRAGRHFRDPVGFGILRRVKEAALDSELQVGCDYICRTCPPQGKEPTPLQIRAFRRDVLATIERVKPKQIIALGHRVVDWLFPNIGYNTAVHRGRRMACRVGQHICWVFPIIGPQQWSLCKSGDSAASPEEYQSATWNDIEAACEPQTGPPKFILPADKKQLMRVYRPTISFVPSTVELERFADEAGSVIALDIETRNKRPYEKGSRILSIAFASPERSLAMPVDHPEVPVDREMLGRIFAGIRKVLRGRTVWAHNVPFELEWLEHFMPGIGAYSTWECSEAAAFMLDTRPGKSLDYLAQQFFGLPLKAISPPRLWNERGQVKELLEYNLLDAGVGLSAASMLQSELAGEELAEGYEHHMRRVRPIVAMQRRGLPISGARVAAFDVEYRKRIDETKRAIAETDEVREYVERFGPFNPTSPDDVVRLFADMLGCESCIRDGHRTSDAEALRAIGDRYESAALILTLRDAEKKLGTYITRYLPGPDSYVMPDGLVHCEYLQTRTQTRRLACINPNNQNWPKRRGREIRSIVKAPDGWVIVSIDLGQVEARVIAMLTGDPAVIRMFTEDYDVHAVWARKLLELDPGVMERRGIADFGKWRACVKNEFVFPCFFGAGAAKIARLTTIPKAKIEKALREFWKEFKAVKRWQKKQLEFYAQNGFVESKLGFRRYGPLKYNMIINTPIQSLASDLCVEGLTRCHQIAEERQLDWWVPIMNIHDDLTFLVPEAEVERFIPEAVRAMIDFDFDFLNVPLTCEVETSREDWSKMETYGVYRSDRLPECR